MADGARSTPVGETGVANRAGTVDDDVDGPLECAELIAEGTRRIDGDRKRRLRTSAEAIRFLGILRGVDEDHFDILAGGEVLEASIEFLGDATAEGRSAGPSL
jgi:hypothetical protein